jgi:selenide,water dikinase
VLIGGGHAHVQVLRRLARRPIPGARVSVVLDRPEAVYSGMVPGFAAGDYAARDLEIDVLPLARRAGAAVVLARALRVDPSARSIELEGRAALRYDVASLDVGSSVRGLELPGVRELALATRPIRGFVDRLEARLEQALRACQGRPLRVAIVGAGVAGVELGFTLCARLRSRAIEAELCVLGAEPEILSGYAPRARSRVRELAARRAIEIRTGASAAAVEKDAVVLDGGERVPADLVVWAAGAASPDLALASPLPRDAAGFVRVCATLEVEGCEGLFAGGDCAALAGAPWVPRAGVYAVRQGPVLDANLRAFLDGRPLRRYRPQRQFLSLMNLGGRRALGTKWGAVVAGRPVWKLKDAIDRRFVRRFDALTEPLPGRMQQPRCGGCAAKLADPALRGALARLGPPPPDASVVLGLERPDDAAAWRTRAGEVVLATLDAFPAFTDDPWLVGSIAALHAASDVWAKGGEPRHALAYVHLPQTDAARAGELLYQVLAGMRAALDPHGISLVGGHTSRGAELLVGLVVLGGAPAPLWTLDGLAPGDRLILSKPLGTGVLLAGDMQGRVAGRHVESVFRSMLRPNADAARVARTACARACTDVSGFGLAGHLAELLRASGVSARLDLDALPALDGAIELLARGVRSTYHEQNRSARPEPCVAPELERDPRLELLFDPQTSGGLLFGVGSSQAAEVLRELRANGDDQAADIGEVTDRSQRPTLAVFGSGSRRA